jgi:hypothetical protein
MRIFGKEKVTADAAAARFILETLQTGKQAWPHVREEIRVALPQSLKRTPNLLDDEWTAYYFCLARLAAEMQAVGNLLPTDVAGRIETAVFAILASYPGTGELSVGFVGAIDKRFKGAVAKGENPVHAIGLTLYESLELDESVEVDGKRFVSPFTLAGLSGVPLQMGLGWWKAYLVTNRII